MAYVFAWLVQFELKPGAMARNDMFDDQIRVGIPTLAGQILCSYLVSGPVWPGNGMERA
jgi:hypothetical protein